jgi:hypothetical protein
MPSRRLAFAAKLIEETIKRGRTRVVGGLGAAAPSGGVRFGDDEFAAATPMTVEGRK